MTFGILQMVQKTENIMMKIRLYISVISVVKRKLLITTDKNT
jgi:hypothetical protein